MTLLVLSATQHVHEPCLDLTLFGCIYVQDSESHIELRWFPFVQLRQLGPGLHDFFEQNRILERFNLSLGISLFEGSYGTLNVCDIRRLPTTHKQEGAGTTGYPLITPGSSRGVPTTVSSLKALAYMRRPDPLPHAVHALVQGRQIET